MMLYHRLGSKRYLVFRREVIELTYDYAPSDDPQKMPPLWRSNDGCVYAFPENGASIDKNDGAGVGWLSWYSWFPWAKKLNEWARRHDYIYSSPAAQVFKTRYEADSYLKFLILIGAEGDGSAIVAQSFKQLSREFGARFWEHLATRDN